MLQQTRASKGYNRVVALQDPAELYEKKSEKGKTQNDEKDKANKGMEKITNAKSRPTRSFGSQAHLYLKVRERRTKKDKRSGGDRIFLYANLTEKK